MEVRPPKKLPKQPVPGFLSHPAPPTPASPSCSAPPAPEPSSSSGPPVPGQEERGRASVLRKIIFPKSIEEYLDEYQRFQAGAAASGRRAESTKSKVSREKAFLYSLSRKKRDLYTWLFMSDLDDVRRLSSLSSLWSQRATLTLVLCSAGMSRRCKRLPRP